MKIFSTLFSLGILTGIFILLFSLFPNSHYADNNALREGWNIHETVTDDWKPTVGKGSLAVSAEVLSASTTANTTASWTLTTEPIWIYRYSELTLRYRARNLVNPKQTPLAQFCPGSVGPVTPGAGNLENPFARAGALNLTLSPAMPCDGQIHEITALVYPPLRTEQIDQIILTIQSGNLPGSLEIFDLSFHEPATAKSSAFFSARRLRTLQEPATSDKFIFIPIPDTTQRLAKLASESNDESRIIECAGMPFRLNPSHSVLSTQLRDRDAISLEVNEKCAYLALLTALNLAGTDEAFHFVPRTTMIQPERLIVTKLYDDGSSEQSFPYSLSHQAYIMETTADAYIIPADPAKVLRSIRVEDRMSYGQVFLAAATVLPPNTANPTTNLTPRFPVSLPPASALTAKSAPTLTVENNSRFILEDDVYRMEFTTENGFLFSSLLYKPSGRNCLLQPSAVASFLIDGNPISPEQLKMESYQAKGDSLEFVFSFRNEILPLRVILQMTADTIAQCRLSLRLENVGYTPRSIRLLFPALRGIQLSEKSSDDFYLFPLRPTALGNENIQLNGFHSGAFPLQFMDVYSESQRFGLALHTQDTEPVIKQFRLKKDAAGCGMGVEYGVPQPIRLEPKQAFLTPPTLLQLHSGDWRAPFQAYKQWSRVAIPSQSPAREVLRNVFLCRRDYPIGGTGRLFDLFKNRYTFSRLIDESKEDLGGVDLIDISGWAYSERFGRVGEYDRYELGGLENLKQGIEESHKQGISVGLYTEGYLVDPRSQIGKQQGSRWQIINRDETPKFWPGNQEMFLCPFCRGWQEFLSQTIRRTAEETGASAMYLDQYGFADESKTCYSPNHGHEIGAHPLRGELEMLRRAREALNQVSHPTALYIEQVPNDVSAQYIDAAFSYGMTGSPPYSSPTKLNLFRYAFPSIKIIELFQPGIDPKAASEENVKLCFFHGHALWLKGRARSWYSRECREFIRKAQSVFHQHENAFTSESVEPLIPTEQSGIYANRFTGNQEEIITLYNAKYQTASGLLLTLAEKEKEIQDLWGMKEFRCETTPGGARIYGTLDPHEIGCLAVKILPSP